MDFDFFLSEHPAKCIRNALKGLRIDPQISYQGRVGVMQESFQDSCGDCAEVDFTTATMGCFEEDNTICTLRYWFEMIQQCIPGALERLACTIEPTKGIAFVGWRQAYILYDNSSETMTDKNDRSVSLLPLT